MASGHAREQANLSWGRKALWRFSAGGKGIQRGHRGYLHLLHLGLETTLKDADLAKGIFFSLLEFMGLHHMVTEFLCNGSEL